MSDIETIFKRYDSVKMAVGNTSVTGEKFSSRIKSLNAAIKDYNYEHKTNIRTRQVGNFGRNYKLLGVM